MRRKNVFLVLMLVLMTVVSCGKKDKNNLSDSIKGSKDNKQSNQPANEIEKYNAYISVYNDILGVDNELREYFREIEKRPNHENPGIGFNRTNTRLVDKVKEAVSKKPKFDSIDKMAQEYITVLEELIPLGEEADKYYKGKDFLSDNFAKAKEIQNKFNSTVPKYKETADKFLAEIDKKAKEIQEKQLKKMEKEGRKITAAKMRLLSSAEAILTEVRAQDLNVVNFTDKGDVTKIKELLANYNKAVDEFDAVIKDKAQLEKEGIRSSSLLESLSRIATNYKGTVATLINRIETKKKESDTIIKMGGIHVETKEGTPENILRTYNELVNQYNMTN